MVKIGLEISANLENVSEVSTIGEDFRWYVMLKCTSCGEVTSSWQYISLEENTETKGGRGSVSMVRKCKMCGRENHIDIIKEQLAAYTNESDGNFSKVVAFECRGMEPVDFEFRSGWVVSSACSSVKFNDVDFSEKEWYEYDENANESLGVTELRHRFVKL
uniref:CXXC motif containing zinc binding protein n=1 Tax=Ciona savignyi TaxID=51511 RepID=H2ZAB2_CIOSA